MARLRTADVISGFHQRLLTIAPSFLRAAYKPDATKDPHFTVDLIPTDHDHTFDGTIRSFRVQVTAWVREDLAAAIELADRAQELLEGDYFCLSGPAFTDESPWFGVAFDYTDVV